MDDCWDVAGGGEVVGDDNALGMMHAKKLNVFSRKGDLGGQQKMIF